MPTKERKTVEFYKKLENHHIAGRGHSNLGITIHASHHINISLRQMFWDSRWNHTFESSNLNISFIIEGLKEYFVEKYFCTGEAGYLILGYSLAPLVKKYREI